MYFENHNIIELLNHTRFPTSTLQNSTKLVWLNIGDLEEFQIK